MWKNRIYPVLEPDQQEPEFEPVSQPNINFVGKPDLSGLKLDLSGLEPDQHEPEFEPVS